MVDETDVGTSLPETLILTKDLDECHALIPQTRLLYYGFSDFNDHLRKKLLRVTA